MLRDVIGSIITCKIELAFYIRLVCVTNVKKLKTLKARVGQKREKWEALSVFSLMENIYIFVVSKQWKQLVITLSIQGRPKKKNRRHFPKGSVTADKLIFRS